MSQDFQFILEKRIMTKKLNQRATTRSHAHPTPKTRKGRTGLNGRNSRNSRNGRTAQAAEPAVTFDLKPGLVGMMVAKNDVEPEASQIDHIGEQLFQAIASKDLLSFQHCYTQLSKLGVDVEEYRRALPNPNDPSKTFMACVASAAVYHYALVLLEQQFRFGMFTKGALYRRTSGSPLTILAGLSTVIEADPESTLIPSYLDVCDRCIGYLYETAFNCRPLDLEPHKGIMEQLKLIRAYDVIEPFVDKHQNFYHGQWLAGLAPNPPQPGGDPLMQMDPPSPSPD